MFDAFSKIDGGGSGRDANDDKRIELDEFLKGYEGVAFHGFVAFQNIPDKKAAKEVFGKMDDNGGGIVLLDEWCTFIKNAEIEANTEAGALLTEEGEYDEAKAAAIKAKAKAPKAKTKAKSVETNSIGLTVGTGKNGASQDYFDFAKCFEPYCAKTPEAEKLREEGMVEADPNGNGLCSLAELETFVLKRLLSNYPNTGKGKDLKTPGKVCLFRKLLSLTFWRIV